MTDLKLIARQIRHRLLDFYGRPAWRVPLAAIDELVSTILSQNTNDLNRDRAYTALRARFHTWEQVLEADPAEVVAVIRPAGLANQKGPRIQKVLKSILEERGSLDLSFLKDMPVDEARAWLKQFKGVGPKTAAIVLLFSLGMPAFPVDTHIHRVTTRLGLIPEGMGVEAAHPALESLFQPETYQDVHLNLIQLGRQLCTARRVHCNVCSLQSLCKYAKAHPN